MKRLSTGALAALLAAACQPMPASAESPLEREFPKLDLSKATIDLSEIQSGGVPRDAIPAILEPRYIPVQRAARDLGKAEPVMSLSGPCGGFAFPYRILIWHEIAHHDHCGTPVAITYCPLCNTSMVFDRRAGGRELTFGTTGRLRHSDLVMYDHQTESFWQQFTGEGIVGEMAGEKLTSVPARIESFARFAARHPDGQVLAPPLSLARNYGANPYAGYDSLPEPFLFRGNLPEGIEPMARVVRIGERAWALTHVREKGRIVTDEGLEIAWTPGQNSALDRSRIAEGRDIGNVSVTRDGQPVAFSVDFAFAFHAFHPDSEIVQ